MSNILKIILLLFFFVPNLYSNDIFLADISIDYDLSLEDDLLDSEFYQEYKDPLEKINRKIFKFNDIFDKYITKNIIDLYQFITPNFFEDRISNFVNNISLINVMINSSLQLDGKNIKDSLSYFAINTTFGLFGLFDVASKYNLSYKDTDFGLTLREYNIKTGYYLVLPIIGPSNFRDLFARITYNIIDPLSMDQFNILDDELIDDNYILYYKITSILDIRIKLDPYIQDIYNNSFDPYIKMRDFYMGIRS